MNMRPKIPMPLLLVGASAVLLLYACTRDGNGFRTGGSEHEDEIVPVPEDTGPEDTEAPDTGPEDTAVVEDTGPEDSEADTAPPFTGSGYNVGDVAHNLVAPNQNDDTWRLYQHAGGPVVVGLGYAQSYTFQEISGFLSDLEGEFSSHGLETVAVLFLNELGNDASREDADSWADQYDLSTVLYDEDHDVRGDWSSATQVKTYLIDEDMVIQWVNTESTSYEQIKNEIEDLVY